MLEFYGVLRFVHILGGALGLLTLVVPFVARKGGRVHTKVGTVFALAMVTAALTGMGIAAFWISIPLTVKPPPASADLAELALRAGRIRTMGAFLSFTGILTLDSISQGLGAIARKKRREGSSAMRDIALPLLVLGGGLVLLVVGIGTADVLFIGFGALGVFVGTQDLRFTIRPLETRMAWWYQHMRGMTAASIAGVTAFMVFNANRFIGLPQGLRFVPWLVPSAVGIPLLAFSIRRYMKKFHELPSGAAPAASSAAPAPGLE